MTTFVIVTTALEFRYGANQQHGASRLGDRLRSTALVAIHLSCFVRLLRPWVNSITHVDSCVTPAILQMPTHPVWWLTSIRRQHQHGGNLGMEYTVPRQWYSISPLMLWYRFKPSYSNSSLSNHTPSTSSSLLTMVRHTSRTTTSPKIASLATWSVMKLISL